MGAHRDSSPPAALAGLRAALLALAGWAALAAAPAPARAAQLLVVSDSDTDLNLVDALEAAGHRVSLASLDFVGGENQLLAGPLSAFDAVFWSATGAGMGGLHEDAALFAHLEAYVSAGGYVLVTGADAVASPTDPALLAFVGASEAVDMSGPPGAIAAVESELTVGAVDLRGLTPTGGAMGQDGLRGLAAGTEAVLRSADGGLVLWSLRRLGAGVIAFVANGAPSLSAPTSSWTDRSAGGAGAYNGALRNFAAAAEAAHRPPGAPIVHLVAPLRAAEGEAYSLRAEIVDEEGDPMSLSWDIDGDGAFGERPGELEIAVGEGVTDGPSAPQVAIAVSDGVRTTTRSWVVRVSNVPPRIRSAPPAQVRFGRSLSYLVEATDAAGEADPLSFALLEGPADATLEGPLLRWRAGPSEALPGPGSVPIAIEVLDGDGGRARQRWELLVTPNLPPDPPTLIYPVGGLEVAGEGLRLVIGNATDPEGDPIEYRFELAPDERFPAATTVVSPMIPQEEGFTGWAVPPELPTGRYYWRASASDGATQSAAPVTGFYLVRGAPRIDAGGPIDASSSTDAGPGGPAGSACAAHPGRSAEPRRIFALLALLALMGALMEAAARSSARRRAR